jgi:predicted dithiol-disulfide oxidoreductase (DUF899 family)
MAPEQMELQQLAEAWHKADYAQSAAEADLRRAENAVASAKRELERYEKVLVDKVGSNTTHKLICVDKDMGDYVLIEYHTYTCTTITRLRLQ